MKKIIILLCLIQFSLYSCVVEQTVDNSKPLPLLNDTKDMVRLSDIFVPKLCVTLDSVVSGRLKWISKIDYVNDRYYVLGGVDRGQLYVFDTNGNFLQNIGSIGHGPGEYVHASDFAIDTTNNRIAILVAPSKVLVYNMDGKFLFAKDLKENAFWNLAWNGDEYVLTTNNFGTLKNDKLMYVYDSSFKLKEKLVDALPFAVGVSGMITSPLQVDGNEVNYIDQASQCIYTYINAKSLAAKSYHWELPNPMPSKEYTQFTTFQQNQHKYDFILDAVKMGDRILVSYKKGEYVYVNLMNTKGVGKVMGHVDISVPQFFKSSADYVFLAIRGRDFRKDIDSYFPKYKKKTMRDEDYLLFKCKLK